MLRQAGIELETGRCLIKCRGKDVESHLALHLEPAALLTEECLAERMYVHCESCGDYSCPPRGELLLRGLDPNPKRGYLIRRDLLPSGKDLVMMRESLEILASDRFREVVQKHKLTGLAFEECGEYV